MASGPQVRWSWGAGLSESDGGAMVVRGAAMSSEGGAMSCCDGCEGSGWASSVGGVGFGQEWLCAETGACDAAAEQLAAAAHKTRAAVAAEQLLLAAPQLLFAAAVVVGRNTVAVEESADVAAAEGCLMLVWWECLPADPCPRWI